MTSLDVAIVGYAARLPGAADASEVWSVLKEGRCTVTELGEDRFTLGRFLDPRPGTKGKSYTFKAGVLRDVFYFDAEDFGISPLEASQMDPQQRLLLENVAHAFDHAGIDPEKISGERTGVYVGASSADHSIFALQDPSRIEGHFMLGNTLSIFANRLSHQWNFQGPSVTIDTACSSGLYAFHQADEDIRSGKIDTAIVSGVNLLLSPMPFIGFSHAGMLSPDGLCRPFSAEANGYVRSEGVVTFILRRASLAAERGDRVRSLVMGSATSNDGAKRGIAVPSAKRQTDLLNRMLRRLELNPDAITYFEAHGTGTPVGDPIEAEAIGASYALGRHEPLPIGSSKSNFGHLEPASGLVGLLKAQLALEHQLIPATLHAEDLNPNIDFKGLNLDPVREARPIAHGDPAIMAISSFGFGGANAHAVLHQTTQQVHKRATAVGVLPSLRLSASSAAALKELATIWRQRLAADEVPSAAIKNANHRLRVRPLHLCVPSGPPREMAATLETWLKGTRSPALEGRTIGRNLDVAFVFGGNGSVWAGMARTIYFRDPTFRRGLRRVSRIFLANGGIDICKTLMSEDLDKRLGDAETDQSLLFAIQNALVSTLRAKGLVPDAVLGHSVGEVAAAVTSGAISTETGVRIILSRSRAFEAVKGCGTMAALVLSQDKTEALVAELGTKVEIGAVNAHDGVTISGANDEVEKLLKAARQRRIAGRRLKVDYAYHSSAVEPLKSVLQSDLENLKCRAPSMPFYSGWSGGRFSNALDGHYWWNNVRQPVRFSDAMGEMCEDGYQVFVEVSPLAVLQDYISSAATQKGKTGVALPGLTRSEQRDATSIVLDALSRGAKVDAAPLLGDDIPISCDLPLYPFNQTEHRLQYERINVLGPNPDHHALLGDRVIEGGHEWRSEISATSVAWIADHRVQGRSVLPATAILEMFAEASRQEFGADHAALVNSEFLRPVILPEEGSVDLRVMLEPSTKKLTLSVRQSDGWIVCATTYAARKGNHARRRILLDWGDNPTELYRTLEDVGLQYGDAFRLIHSVAVKEGQIDARLAPIKEAAAFLFDPMRADAALHALGHLIPEALRTSSSVLLPARIDRWERVSGNAISGARLTLRDAGDNQLTVDVAYVDAEGSVAFEMTSLRLRPAILASKPKPQFWCEDRMLVGRAALTNPLRQLLRCTLPVPKETSDIVVLRDVLGCRLAWDAMTDGTECLSEVAASIVRARLGQNIAEDETCPWPEREALIELLMSVAPSASEELLGALESSRDRGNATRLAANLHAAAFKLMKSLDISRLRLGVAGQVTPALLTMLKRDAGALTFFARDAAQADGIELQFEDGDRPTIRRFPEGDKGVRVDLLLMIGMSGHVSEVDTRSLLRTVADNGLVMAVEEMNDAFSVMTGRHGSTASLDRFRKFLSRTGATVQTRIVADHPTVHILVAEPVGERKAKRPDLRVGGAGTLESELARICNEPFDGLKIHVVPAVESADEFARTVWPLIAQASRKGETTWLVQEGLTNVSALQGWRRAFVNETNSDFRTAAVDAATDLEFVAQTLAETEEEELVFEEGFAFAPRVRKAAVATGAGARLVLEKTGSFGGGQIDWRRRPRPKPRDREIEVQVEAIGLNFRDVMWAGDMLPHDAMTGGYVGATLGMECAGRIVRACPESVFDVGERVALVAPAAFSTHVVAPETAAIAIPDDVSSEAAAGLPVAYATALYALEDLADLKIGESILIHAATGGVGLAAVHLARSAGARIIATAGTPAKRRLLGALGVSDVFDSRNLDFPSMVMEATDGKGVDVVLNSLSGDAMQASHKCLAPFGRFLELGKRDYFAGTHMSLQPFRNNLSYFGVDLDQTLRFRPGLAERLFSKISSMMKNGEVAPLPYRVFEADSVSEAFETLKRAEHIGKIVVKPPKAVRSPVRKKAPIRGTWLVIGGASGFGLKTAEWLARRGAEKLWLVNRTGKVATESVAALKNFSEIRVRACDVTDKEELRILIDEIDATDSCLNGVVHAAMVLRDKPFKDLDQADVDAVVRPKVAGAENLDELTRVFKLDHFWMYGSVVARFGSVGQAPYVAANMALEDIAVRRAAEGLPALTITWGPILDAGYLVREDEVRKHVERQFEGQLTAAVALAKLGEFLESGSTRPTITIATSPRPAMSLPCLSGPLMSEFSERKISGGDAVVETLAALLENGKDDDARAVLLELMRAEAARVARSDVASIDVNRPLNEIGFDSLMGVNLLFEIEKRLGSSVAMLDGSVELSIQRLANRILVSMKEHGRGMAAEMATRHISSTELSQREIDDIVETTERVDGRS